MNTQTTQDCADARESIGQQLRSARIAKGYSVADVAARMRVLACVVQDIENDDFSRLGADIFVRGHLSSYCRLLDVEMPTLATASAAPPQSLRPMTHTSRVQRAVERSARSLVYVVLTASIGIPVVWFALNAPDAGVPAVATLTRLDPLPGAPVAVSPEHAAATSASAPSPTAATATEVAQSPAPPVVASLAGFYPQTTAAPAPASVDGDESDAATGVTMVLHFRERSWLEVRSNKGDRLDEALMQPGDERRYALDQIGRVTLGNAAGVDVNIGDALMDTSAYRRADVARFKVSSDGRLAPSDG